jgi:drug/metabolite transporter (DMT)-like permease
MRKPRGYLSLFITILIWGTTFLVTKVVLREIGPLQLTELRFVLAFLLLAPLAARQGFHLKQIFTKEYMLFGLTGTTLYYVLQNVGLTLTSVSSTVLILASVPALTTILAVIFLKERIGKSQIIGIGLVTVGVVLVSLEGGQGETYAHPLLGNLIIFVSGLSWAIYTIQGRKMASGQPALVMAAAGIGAGMLQLLPLAGWELATRGLPHLSGMGWLGVAFLSFASSGLTTYLWNDALHYLPASVASSYINLVPIIGIATAYLLGEQPPLIQITGGVLAILGVLLSSRPTH